MYWVLWGLIVITCVIPYLNNLSFIFQFKLHIELMNESRSRLD